MPSPSVAQRKVPYPDPHPWQAWVILGLLLLGLVLDAGWWLLKVGAVARYLGWW